MTRRCRKCGRVFPLNKDNFGHQPNGGYRYNCRACMRANTKRHYYENPGQVAERASWRRSTSLSASERLYYKRLLVAQGGFVCFYCKRDLDSSFHIDHKIPATMGGEHALENFALACVQCNQEKYNRTIDQYRAWLRARNEDVNF